MASRIFAFLIFLKVSHRSTIIQSIFLDCLFTGSRLSGSQLPSYVLHRYGFSFWFHRNNTIAVSRLPTLWPGNRGLYTAWCISSVCRDFHFSQICNTRYQAEKRVLQKRSQPANTS